MSFDISKFLRDHGTTILCALGCVGVIGTGVSAALCAPKASRKLQEARDANEGILTTKDAIKAVAASQWPTAVVGAATIGCIVSGQVINTKQKAELIAGMGALAVAGYRNKDKLKPTVPTEVKQQTHHDGEELFYEENYGYFWANPYDVMSAICQMQKEFSKGDGVGLWEFFYNIGIKDKVVEGWRIADLGFSCELLCEIDEYGLDIQVPEESYYTPEGDKYHQVIFPDNLIEDCHDYTLEYHIPDDECAQG